MLPKLEERFKDIYLIRNERFLALYNFDDGTGFEPDFLLFAKEKENNNQLMYQLFIEPKGGHLEEHDEWKQNFLLELQKMAEIDPKNFKSKDTLGFADLLDMNPNYKIWGMPFYLAHREFEFMEYVENIGIDS